MIEKDFIDIFSKNEHLLDNLLVEVFPEYAEKKAKEILEEVYTDPDLKNATVSPESHEVIFNAIREIEEKDHPADQEGSPSSDQ